MGAAPATIEKMGPSSQDASPTESHNGDSAADGLMTTAARYHQSWPANFEGWAAPILENPPVFDATTQILDG